MLFLKGVEIFCDIDCAVVNIDMFVAAMVFVSLIVNDLEMAILIYIE